MTENSLESSIKERFDHYKSIIADLETKNASLARLACTYAVELDKTKNRTPTEYAQWHRISKEEWK